MVSTAAVEVTDVEDLSSESEEWISDDEDDDEVDDPTFDVVLEAESSLSKLSVGTSRSRGVEVELESDGEDPVEGDVEVPKLNADDEKGFEIVSRIVEGGHFEKLKLVDCKLYLRKYGLRLTGKKEVLINRIKEYKRWGWNGKVSNLQFCYQLQRYSKVTRSAVGDPCGERLVAGRIVKESYGAAKQQHTFTIEVLWSKGVKPLPPLHPLLIKGRNLYKMQTRRQRWLDEEERKKALYDKHTRGDLARVSREARLQVKQARIKLGKNRKNTSVNDDILPVRPVDKTKTRVGQNQTMSHTRANLDARNAQDYKIADNCLLQKPPSTRQPWIGEENMRSREPTTSHGYQQHGFHHQPPLPIRPNHLSWQKYSVPGGNYQFHNSPFSNRNPGFPPGQPLTNMNKFSQQLTQQPARCRYYQQGRCRYGDTCKWLHD